MSQIKSGEIYSDVQIGRDDSGKAIKVNDVMEMVKRLSNCLEDIRVNRHLANALGESTVTSLSGDEQGEYDQVLAEAKALLSVEIK